MKKRSRTGQRAGQILLLLVCCGLGYLVWEEANRESFKIGETTGIQPTEASVESSAIIKDIQFPPLTGFEEITKRPLFFENRQPYVFIEPANENKNPGQGKPVKREQQTQFVLNAVIITPQQQIAVIQSGQDSNQQKIALGESIDGWTLEEVTYDAVTLTKAGATQNLELEIKGSLQKTLPTPAADNQKNRPGNAVNKQKHGKLNRKILDSAIEQLQELPAVEE